MFYRRETVCRSCGDADLADLLSLGLTPLADRLRSASQLDEPEPQAPLDLALCRQCALVQIRQTVSRETLFGPSYLYYSSVAQTVVENARRNVASLSARYDLGPRSAVLEIAANDGYLLAQFAALGIPVLGVDPATGPAAAARGRGVPMIEGFFSAELARGLAAEGRRFDVVIANNVLAHVDQPHDFLEGVRAALRDGGVAVFEVPYVLDLLDGLEFDTIYHQHLCYFSLTALERLFEAHGLAIHDVERLPIHGGSLRVHAGLGGRPRSNAVEEMLAAEQARGVDEPACYAPLKGGMGSARRELHELLRELRAGGKSIAAYGAAAKGTTLLSVCGVGADLIDYVVDRNPHKHGLYTGGPPLLIRPVETLVEERPNYVLLLAWNHAPEILEQQKAYLEAGGRFIVPVPRPEVVAA